MRSSLAEHVVGEGRDAVPRSRAFVRRLLAGRAHEVADDAALVATELVTNALLHGRRPVRLRLRDISGGVRLEVEDAGADVPVRPRQRHDAMTGRGLSLVARLARGWGVEPSDRGGKVVWAELTPGDLPTRAGADVDVDALLESFPDDAAGVPMFTVELGEVPTDLLLTAKAHIDNLVREFTLEAAAAEAGTASGVQAVPPDLARLVATVVHGFAAARTSIKQQALAAAERGEPEVRLSLTLPASAADAGEEYLAALDETDRWARQGRLLTTETPPVHKVFRHWYVQTLVDQLRAAAAGRTPPPTVPFPQRLAEALPEEAGAAGSPG